MMKLKKEEFNEFLYYITEDNPKYGLIFKITYIYGRNMKETLCLKKEDINFTENKILFHTFTDDIIFPLTMDLKKELIEYISINNIPDDEDLFLNGKTKLETLLKTLNTYLANITRSLNKTLHSNYPELTNRDFKRLRGQHLFLDGADINTIHELYHNSSKTLTRKLIKYNELVKLKFPCNDLNTLFTDYTDLEVYNDERYDTSDLVTVIGEDDNMLIELDYINTTINLLSDPDNNLSEKIMKIQPRELCKNMHRLKPGNYRYMNNLQFIKN